MQQALSIWVKSPATGKGLKYLVENSNNMQELFRRIAQEQGVQQQDALLLTGSGIRIRPETSVQEAAGNPDEENHHEDGHHSPSRHNELVDEVIYFVEFVFIRLESS